MWGFLTVPISAKTKNKFEVQCAFFSLIKCNKYFASELLDYLKFSTALIRFSKSAVLNYFLDTCIILLICKQMIISAQIVYPHDTFNILL